MAKVGTAEFDVQISRAKVRAEVEAAGKEIEKGLGGSAEKAAKEIEDKLGKLRERSGMVVGAGTAAALGLSIKAASDLNEAQNKANVTFGESSKVVNDFAASAATAFGLSKKEALDATSTFGNLFVQLGVGADKAAQLSTKMVGLASDFGSFFNEDPKSIIEAQTAAFRGEYDALQRYVPTINAAAVEQEALAETGKSNADALTQQEKALATYSLMIKGAGPAAGDFARTNDSLANSSKIARAELTNAAATIGQELLPVAAEAAHMVAEVVAAFGHLPGPVQTGIVGIGGLTLATGLLVPKLMEGAKVLQLMGSKAADQAAKLIDTASAVEGLGGEAAESKGKVASLLSSVGSSPGVMAGAAIGVGVLVAAYMEMSAEAARAKKNTDDLVDGARQAGKSIQDVFDEKLANTVAGVSGGFSLTGSGGAFSDTAKRLGLDAAEIKKILSMSKADFTEWSRSVVKELGSSVGGQFVGNLDSMRGSLAEANSKTKAQTKAQKELGVSATEAGSAEQQLATDVKSSADGFDEARRAAKELFDARRGLTDADQGVIDAVKGVADAQAGVADAEKALTEAHRGVAEAARGVRSAERDLAGARADSAKAAEDLAQAQHDVVYGTKELAQAQQDVERANRGVVDAEKALADAQRESKAAQEDLTRARDAAKESLDDMGRSAESAALAEESARLSLAEARDRLSTLGQRRGSDGTVTVEPVSALDRQRAELAVRQAELSLRDAIDRNQDTAAQLAEMRQRGIEGSDEVVAAQERITAAADAETAAREHLTEAQQAVLDAEQHVTDVREELAARVVEAEQAVVEANQRVEDAALKVRDAHDQVAQAQQRVIDAKDGVVAARQAVTDAENAVTNALLAQVLAQAAVDEQTGGAAEATRLQIERLTDLANKLDPNNPLRQYLLGLVGDLRQAAGDWNINLNMTTFWQDVGAAPPGFNNAERMNGRAGGGPVRRGVPYIVGERRPEVFVPEQDGTIVPSVGEWAARQPSSGAPAPGGASFQNHFYGITDAEEASEIMLSRAAWQLAGAGV